MRNMANRFFIYILLEKRKIYHNRPYGSVALSLIKQKADQFNHRQSTAKCSCGAMGKYEEEVPIKGLIKGKRVHAIDACNEAVCGISLMGKGDFQWLEANLEGDLNPVPRMLGVSVGGF
jgi:hypothetical protein